MWDLQNYEQLAISTATIKRVKRKEALHPAPPQPPAPVWRFYERRHPHRLWHADFMDKIRLTDAQQTVHQLPLQDD